VRLKCCDNQNHTEQPEEYGPVPHQQHKVCANESLPVQSLKTRSAKNSCYRYDVYQAGNDIQNLGEDLHSISRVSQRHGNRLLAS
jgi:hypothetical protein